MTAPPDRSRRLLVPFAIAAVVLAAGALLARRSDASVDRRGERWATPGELVLDLPRGEHALYERSGTLESVPGGGGRRRGRHGSTTYVHEVPTVVTPVLVTVTAADGTTVPVTGPAERPDSFRRDRTEYRATVRFTVPADGDYRVQVTGPATEVAVERTGLGGPEWVTTAVLLALPLVVVAMIAGLVWFAVVQGPRRRWWQRSTAVAPSAPGWYADPYDRRVLRWWDGRNWTVHTAPVHAAVVLPTGGEGSVR